MKSMKIATSGELVFCPPNHRQMVSLDSTDLIDVAAIIVIVADGRNGILVLLKRTGSHALVLLFTESDADPLAGANAVIRGQAQDWLELESVVCQYKEDLLSPLYDTLTQYVEMGNSIFACPGHQHGEFFKKHSAGRHFYEFFGENLFRTDICNANVKLDDLLIHKGSAKHTQKLTAKAFHVDKTYSALNGIPVANKIVTNVLLMRGDLVLSDYNNHKSDHHGTLIQAGTTLVYLEAARNPFGFIGSTDEHYFDEEYLRQQPCNIAPQRAEQSRPFRPAIIQLDIYDDMIYNAWQVVDKIGHLHDHILFGSVWVSYEQFIPMMADGSLLLSGLDASDPGILVAQSTHKQQAEFPQTLQIHKKDNRIRGQMRLYPHEYLNDALMLYASTSPFYPLFVTLDVSTEVRGGENGRRLWAECVALGIEVRKAITTRCRMIQLSVPLVADGKPWEGYPTQVITSECHFFGFGPGAK